MILWSVFNWIRELGEVVKTFLIRRYSWRGRRSFIKGIQDSILYAIYALPRVDLINQAMQLK